MLLLLLLSLLTIRYSEAAYPSGRPSLADDGSLPAFFASSDMLWDWAANGPDPLAPIAWFQAAYIGNGLVGALVRAVPCLPNTTCAPGSTPALRIDMGRTDVWANGNRQPVGFFTVTPVQASLARVVMRLELARAMLHINMTLADAAQSVLNVQLFVNADDPTGPSGVLVAAISPPMSLAWAWTPDTSGVGANRSVVAGSSGTTAYYTQCTPDGTYTTAFASQNQEDASASVLVLALANSQRSAAPTAAQALAIAAVAASLAPALSGALAVQHTAWWTQFWGASFFAFDSAGRAGVTRLESFAHIASYRYASAARFSLSDLMGPWGPRGNDSSCIGPWCQFCWDMNEQVMMYLPTPANRGVVLAAPAFDMLNSLVTSTWTAEYGSNPPSGQTNILWFLAQLHRYCVHYGDDARLLSTLLPLLRQQLQAANLHNGTDGLLHVENCQSPEYPMPPSTDCTYDLSIYRWAAATALALSAAFAPADPARALYKDIVARLSPFPVDQATGSFMVAQGVPFAVPHRHYSHLLMIYDLGLGLESASVDTVVASVDVWWNITCAAAQTFGPIINGDEECRGFTQAALAAMSAVLNRTDAAMGNLTSYLAIVGLPNAMYGEEVYFGHPDMFSPVSESAYSAAASVYGMLVSSRVWNAQPQSGSADSAAPRQISLWPAVPSQNVSIFRLRCEGALLVSAVREQGATLWAAIEADLLVGGIGAGTTVPVLLYNPDWENVASLALTSDAPGVTVDVVPGKPGSFLLAGLPRGSAVAVYPATRSAPFSFVVSVPAGRNASEFNAWGSRFVYRGVLAS